LRVAGSSYRNPEKYSEEPWFLVGQGSLSEISMAFSSVIIFIEGYRLG